jgi:hypothetical protein
MKDIEKNDVNISNLFVWGAKTTIPTNKGEKDIWVRVVGDADISRARVYALRKSAELRRKLKDLDSDERMAMIPEFDADSKEQAIELLLNLRIKEITDDALDDVEIVYPKEPASDASLEEQEEYQASVDNFPKYVEKQTRKAVETQVEKERERIKNMSMEGLEELYVNTLVNQLCETEMYQAFQDKTVFYACFTDENYTSPLFSDFEMYLNLPLEIKEKLATFYGTLTLDIDTLKK